MYIGFDILDVELFYSLKNIPVQECLHKNLFEVTRHNFFNVLYNLYSSKLQHKESNNEKSFLVIIQNTKWYKTCSYL